MLRQQAQLVCIHVPPILCIRVVTRFSCRRQEFVSLAGAEVYRGNAEKEKRIYPGGPFDPLGFAKVRHLQSGIPIITFRSVIRVQNMMSIGRGKRGPKGSSASAK